MTDNCSSVHSLREIYRTITLQESLGHDKKFSKMTAVGKF
jgi:hypothetical protein